MTNSWRAIARHARDRIVEADPEEVPYILSVSPPRVLRIATQSQTFISRAQLWYLRLSSLARMRLFNQTSAECTNLFTVLHAIEPPETRVFLFDRVLPFELEVLYAKLKYWAGDHMGYLDALAALLNRCKSKARAAKADQAASAMWTERGSRVCLIIASQLIEMKVRAYLPPPPPHSLLAPSPRPRVFTSGADWDLLPPYRTLPPRRRCSSRCACKTATSPRPRSAPLSRASTCKAGTSRWPRSISQQSRRTRRRTPSRRP